MKKISFSYFVIFSVVVFCSLGTWQLYRLQWKLDLINQINTGLKSAPIQYTNSINKNYQKITVKGAYNFKDQIYLYNLNENGKPGYEVITPFITLKKEDILINRGWIKKELKDSKEINKQIDGNLYGILIKINKPNIFKPENNLDKNIWFSLNQKDLKEFTGKKFGKFIIYLSNSEVSFPKPKKVTIDIPNNHLKYAITWYAISISIFFYFLYFRKTKK